MKFTVDLNQCENHGQCTFSAPSQFALADNGMLSFRAAADSEYVSPDLTPDQEVEAGQAADMCPMQAISLVG